VSWNVFSLVLACVTGWSLLFVGYLPVATVRRLGAEPVKAAGAWAIVAVTAPAAIFHWYLIFAIICFIAWTKLERPAGKIGLAIAAALGLSLGVIFPLDTSPALLNLKAPAPLALLYLGGATTGLAYVIGLLALEPNGRILRKSGRWLALSALAWTALLIATLLRTGLLSVHRTFLLTNGWVLLALAIGMLVLALLTWNAVRRGTAESSRWLATATAFAAFASTLLAEMILRTGPSLVDSSR
jgi:hypothetical protein